MPFKYIIKWKRTNPEKVSVEAYHKYPQTEEEKRKPAFIIGKAEGSGLLTIRHLLEKAVKNNPTKKRGSTICILLNENEEKAYETAYRIGLAVALINKAKTTQELQKGVNYILNATPEEIWFWTSKLLDDEINTRALDALAVLSGSMHIKPITSTTKTTPKIPKPRRGTFWPMVRQRMKEKATQLYLNDHPETEINPTLKELCKTGYLQAAKKKVLREINLERKKTR